MITEGDFSRFLLHRLRRSLPSAGGSARVTGVTIDGMRVVSGTFKMADTHGLPLWLQIKRLKGSGMIPDWVDYMDSALSAGWKPKTIVSRLADSLFGVYPDDMAGVIINRCKWYLSNKGAI